MTPATFTDEEFCVVPAGKMFFVLSYSHGDLIPDITYNGLEAWLEFLEKFQIKEIR